MKVLEGANAQLFGRLHKRGEDVHRPSPAHTSAVQAHIASPCTYTSTQLRCVVVQRNLGCRQNRQQFAFLRRRLGDPIIERNREMRKNIQEQEADRAAKAAAASLMPPPPDMPRR